MAQCGMAGFTTYENQSLSDIVEDIKFWIEYSKQTIEFVQKTIAEIKDKEFFEKISYEYKSYIFEIIQICKTNIEDFQQVLYAIENHQLTNDKVSLFFKIGKRAVTNSDDNKKYFKLSDDGRCHDYGNPDFHKIEDLYAKFGDYSATLWDVTNAAVRLRDYIDVPKEISTMKYENKSINIGNGNEIVGSAIGYDNKAEIKTNGDNEEKLPSKIVWNVLVPIVVGVIVVAICVWLGIQK